MPPVKELHQLLDHSPTLKSVITLQAVTWINNNSKLSNEIEITEIIQCVSVCYIVEKEALPSLQQWLNYRTNRDLAFFAHYAALQFAKEGGNSPELIEIIEEMFTCEYRLVFECIARNVLELDLDDLSSSQPIFTTIVHGIHCSSMRTSASICSTAILDLILHMELQRITSNALQQPESSTRSYFWIIATCSPNVQLHLAEHLLNYVNIASNSQNCVVEEYVAVVTKWMILSLLWYIHSELHPQVFKCIFTFLHNNRLPQVQKAMVNGLNVLFFQCNLSKEHVFVKNDIINHLEQIICSYTTGRSSCTNDVLAASLLAYGNVLLILQTIETSHTISDETMPMLQTLSQRLPSDSIAARATLCCIFLRTRNTNHSLIFSLVNKLGLAAETNYNIFLELTLYQIVGHDLFQEAKIVAEYLRNCSEKVVQKFVVELYDSLKKRESRDYLSDFSPDYSNVAIHFIVRSSDQFLCSLKESTFSNENFKTAIFDAHRRAPNDILIVLYTTFGVITIELVNMLASHKDGWSGDVWKCLEKNPSNIRSRHCGMFVQYFRNHMPPGNLKVSCAAR